MKHQKLSSILSDFRDENELIEMAEKKVLDEYFFGKKILEGEYCDRPYAKRLQFDSQYNKFFKDQSHEVFEFFDDTSVFSVFREVKFEMSMDLFYPSRMFQDFPNRITFLSIFQAYEFFRASFFIDRVSMEIALKDKFTTPLLVERYDQYKHVWYLQNLELVRKIITAVVSSDQDFKQKLFRERQCLVYLNDDSFWGIGSDGTSYSEEELFNQTNYYGKILTAVRFEKTDG